MKKVSGREAIGILAEIQSGKRKATDIEVKHLYHQVALYRNWLMKTKSMSRADADNRCKKLYNDDLKTITETDPYADHVWSRGEEVGDLEVNAAKAIHDDLEKQLQIEFESEQQYWDQIETIAEKASKSGFNFDAWKKQNEKFQEVMKYLNQIKAKVGERT